MYPSPGVKRTFPHIPICGTEFPGVEQEAGTVLLVAFPGRPPPNRAPLVWTQHLVDGGAVLVSQGGRGCITILLGIWRGRWRQSKGGTTHRRIIVIFFSKTHQNLFLLIKFEEIKQFCRLAF